MTVKTNTPRPGETAEQTAARTAPRNQIAERHTIPPYKMRRVIVESPFSGDVVANIRYARACLRDCLLRGEYPYASHLLLTQDGILDDTIEVERIHGINAGHAWMHGAQAVVVYQDLGISKGMEQGINSARINGLPVEYRQLGWYAPETADSVRLGTESIAGGE